MRIRNSYGQYWYIASNNSYDIYYNNDKYEELLIANDNVETCDREIEVEVPGKGKILTAISAEFAALAEEWGFNTSYIGTNVVRNNGHTNLLFGSHRESVFHDIKALSNRKLAGRVTLIERLHMLPIECVVFRHLIGPVWDAYQNNEKHNYNLQLPRSLNNGDEMPRSILVTIDRNSGETFIDDINKTSEIIEQSQAIIVDDSAATAACIYDMCIGFYDEAYRYAQSKGIIIANAVFELGIDDFGRICFGGGFMTPDSALFWDESDLYFGEYPKPLGINPINSYIIRSKFHSGDKPRIPRSVLEEAKKGYQTLNKMLFSS